MIHSHAQLRTLTLCAITTAWGRDENSFMCILIICMRNLYLFFFGGACFYISFVYVSALYLYISIFTYTYILH